MDFGSKIRSRLLRRKHGPEKSTAGKPDPQFPVIDFSVE